MELGQRVVRPRLIAGAPRLVSSRRYFRRCRGVAADATSAPKLKIVILAVVLENHRADFPPDLDGEVGAAVPWIDLAHRGEVKAFHRRP